MPGSLVSSEEPMHKATPQIFPLDIHLQIPIETHTSKTLAGCFAHERVVQLSGSQKEARSGNLLKDPCPKSHYRVVYLAEVVKTAKCDTAG